MTDPFRSRPPVFPRDRLTRAGLDADTIDRLDGEFTDLPYREKINFARFVNSHTDGAIRDRLAGDTTEATSGQTQPTGGQPTDEQQIAQLDAAAAPVAPAPGPADTGTTGAAPQTATEEAPAAVAAATPEPAPQQQEATPAAAEAPADAPPPAEPPAPTITVGDTAVPADPAALNDLTVDQLRQAATSVGVPTTGRKAELVDRVVTAATAPPADAGTPAPAEAPQEPAQPPAEATTPAPAPEPATGDQGAPQTPAATDGGNTTGGTTP